MGLRYKILILSGILFFPLLALAHSGKTDADGCHTNRKTGEYHCHNQETKSARTDVKTTARGVMKDIDFSSNSCKFDFYNCADFENHEQAQKLFEFCGSIDNDIHRLDADNDGLACEK